MQRYVVDSSVFNKLYLDEIDRDKAQQLFILAMQNKVELLAPDLLYLEVINTAQRCGIPIDEVAELLSAQQYLMTMRALNHQERKRSLEIIAEGHPNSGYPSIYDAAFHAMAMCNDAIFITADKRHYAKTKHLGYIGLLSDFNDS
ncbi:MAG TPA: PIN domain-containing protein [Leucothrix mucor]|nr:PIN domain-containing protein [Leucothrix mucor]